MGNTTIIPDASHISITFTLDCKLKGLVINRSQQTNWTVSGSRVWERVVYSLFLYSITLTLATCNMHLVLIYYLSFQSLSVCPTQI